MNRAIHHAREFVRAFAAATLAAFLAACASSPPAPAAHDDPHPGSMQIIRRHCDDRGAVDDILIHADGAGTVGLRWDNARVCGTPT